MKHFFTARLFAALVTLLLAGPLAGRAQNITQVDFTGVVVPQFLSSGNNSTTATNPGPRLAFVFRGALTNLAASTTYRYYVQASTAADFGATGTAGVVLSLTPGATPAASAYVTSAMGSLSTAGSYATFTTDGAGGYTGWFGFVNTANARFTTVGNVLFPVIVLATDAAPATIVARRALDLGATVLAFGPAAATNGTLLTGSSAATPKNLVFAYDNPAGTGRPTSGGLVEAVGVTTGAVATYATSDGAYSVFVPNALPNGIRRVEERSIVTGAVLNCNQDADGVWPSGAATANPTGGATPVVLAATDTPLNAGCGAAPTATLTATPTAPLSFSTPASTASAPQTVSISGSGLSAGVAATASAGYEVALAAAGPYSAALALAPTAGTLAATPVYVRLASTATAGPVNGTLTFTSTGATGVTIVLNGTVTSAGTAAPTVTSFAPASGPVGTTVTVTGTNLAGASGAMLNGLAVANFMAMGATSVMFDVPAGATSGPVAVTTAGGTGTSTGAFTVTAPVAVPTITSLTPNAQVVGGAAVTLTVAGTGFTPTTTLSFNGVTYAQTSSTATSLVATVPASAVATVGNYAVTVTNTAGTSNVNTFTVSNPSTAGAFETFEAGTKTGYTAGNVTLGSGVWTFSDALIGTGFSDRFNGLKSARVRAGFIAMNFDLPTGAGTVVVNAGLYGSDTGATFLLEKSTNGGATYTTVPGGPAALTAALTPYTFAVNQAGPVRFRITNTTTATTRISIDDLSVAPFTAAPVIVSFTPSTGGPGATVTVTGTGFSGATQVRIGAFNVPVFTVVSATSLTFVVPTGTGSVNGFIAITTPGGTATSATTFNLISATLAAQALPGLAVFPNPATDRLTVALPTAGAATVALRDLAGRAVLAPAALAADQQLHLPARLPAGMYLLEVRQGGVTAVRRIQKN